MAEPCFAAGGGGGSFHWIPWPPVHTKGSRSGGTHDGSMVFETGCLLSLASFTQIVFLSLIHLKERSKWVIFTAGSKSVQLIYPFCWQFTFRWVPIFALLLLGTFSLMSLCPRTFLWDPYLELLGQGLRSISFINNAKWVSKKFCVCLHCHHEWLWVVFPSHPHPHMEWAELKFFLIGCKAVSRLHVLPSEHEGAV